MPQAHASRTGKLDLDRRGQARRAATIAAVVDRWDDDLGTRWVWQAPDLPGANRRTPGNIGDDRASRKRVSTIARFCSSLHDRRRWHPVIISILAIPIFFAPMQAPNACTVRASGANRFSRWQAAFPGGSPQCRPISVPLTHSTTRHSDISKDIILRRAKGEYLTSIRGNLLYGNILPELETVDSVDYVPKE